MVINDDDVEGVFAISLVTLPAISVDYVYMSKEKECKFCSNNLSLKTIDADKHLVAGPILIPDIEIKRLDEETQEDYYIFFKPETIRKISQNYLINGYQNSVTLEHDKKVNTIFLVESWIVDGKNDKSTSLGFDLPEGTWFGIMKVNDEDIWQSEIKSDILRGFSIEGTFDHKLLKKNLSDDELLHELRKIYSEFKYKEIKKKGTHKQKVHNIVKLKVYKTNDNKKIKIDDLTEGKVAYIVADDLTETIAPSGEYKVGETRINVGINGVMDHISGDDKTLVPNILEPLYQWTLGSGGERGVNCEKCIELSEEQPMTLEEWQSWAMPAEENLSGWQFNGEAYSGYCKEFCSCSLEISGYE